LGSASTPIWLRGVTATALVGLSVWVGVDMVRLHPYEYVYFNRSSGGLREAFGRYETDYWGASFKEGLQWVMHKLPAIEPGQPIRVASCDSHTNDLLHYYVERWPDAAERLNIVPDYRRADVFLAVTRGNCHNVPGKVLHRVQRLRVPLLYVVRTEHR
jgi:hypothetical protein